MPGVYDIFRPPTATLSPTLTKMVTPEVRKDSTTISRAEYNVEELNNLITNLIVQLQGKSVRINNQAVLSLANIHVAKFCGKEKDRKLIFCFFKGGG